MPILFEKFYNGSFKVASESSDPFSGALRSPLALDEERDAIIECGKKASETAFPVLKASVYMQFCENGNRSVYERDFFNRRTLMLRMALGIAYGGKYAKELGDALWAVCEESTWVIPAHNRTSGKNGKLTYAYDEVDFIDLFSATTAACVSAVLMLAGKELDAVTPDLCKRAFFELNRRIIKPFLKYDNMWWMGFDGRSVNNWNPWIVSNVLTVCAFAVTDTDTRRAVMMRAMKMLDNFTRTYHEDGGCDEGCGYWSAAGASYFDCAEILYALSDGEIDVFKIPFVRRVGEYIMDFYVGNGYCVNFADCSPKAAPPVFVTRRFGRRTGSAALTATGESRFNGKFSPESLISNMMPYRGLLDMCECIDLIQNGKSDIPAAKKSVYYPGIDVAIFRGSSDFGKGVTVAVKGGHNNESHNHNDVGTFSVYHDSAPLIIDAGVETYTAKTFSSERYSIWTMRSDYHNLPSFCGVTQASGIKFRATEQSYDENGSYSVSLKEAYPTEANLTDYRRTVAIKNGKITVNDKFKLTKAGEVCFHLMLCDEPEISSGGQIKLNGELTLSYDPSLEAAVEALPLTDSKIKGDWNREKLYRLKLYAANITSGDFTLVLQ